MTGEPQLGPYEEHVSGVAASHEKAREEKHVKEEEGDWQSEMIPRPWCKFFGR